MISSDDESTSTPSEKQCSQSKCKTILPLGSKYKTCEKCHNLAITAASFAHRGSRKDRKGRRRSTGVCVGRSIFRKQLRRAGWETKISHIVIDNDYKKSSEEDEVSINSFYSRRSDFHSDKQCWSNVPMIFQDSRWLGILLMDLSIQFCSRITASWKHFKKKGQGSFSLQKTVSVMNIDSIQARKHCQQCGRAQLQTRCFINVLLSMHTNRWNIIKLNYNFLLHMYIAPTCYIQ